MKVVIFFASWMISLNNEVKWLSHTVEFEEKWYALIKNVQLQMHKSVL